MIPFQIPCTSDLGLMSAADLLDTPAGKAGSISFYRAIQLGYTAAAAFLALRSCRRLLRHPLLTAGQRHLHFGHLLLALADLGKKLLPAGVLPAVLKS